MILSLGFGIAATRKGCCPCYDGFVLVELQKPGVKSFILRYLSQWQASHAYTIRTDGVAVF